LFFMALVKNHLYQGHIPPFSSMHHLLITLEHAEFPPELFQFISRAITPLLPTTYKSPSA